MEEGNLRIQDYLSFGYLYLVTLGILRDSIYLQSTILPKEIV